MTRPIPHLCQNDAGARKQGCLACSRAYWATHKRKPYSRKVRPGYVSQRILSALRLGFELTQRDIWPMIGQPEWLGFVQRFYDLRDQGLVVSRRDSIGTYWSLV